jgi:CHAT domain-containing protein
VRYQAWPVLARGEQPALWAKARRGALFEARCRLGHVNSVAVPTLLYDAASGRTLFVPTEPEAAQKQLNDLLLQLLPNIDKEGRLEVEVIRPDQVAPVLEAMEGRARTGTPLERASDRIFVVESRAQDDVQTFMRAFERPTPETAMRIALRCDRLLLSDGLDERQRVDLSAQRALCYLLAEKPPPGVLDIAVATFRKLLPLFEARGSQADWAATQRNLGEALLRRSPRTDAVDARAALEALDAAAEFLTKDYSLHDWARVQVGRADALVRIGGAEALINARASIRSVLLRSPGADPLHIAERARHLYEELDRALHASVVERIARDPVEAINEMLRERDHDALLKLATIGLEGDEPWADRPVLLYCKGLALLHYGELDEAQGREAILALEEAVESASEESVPAAKATSLLFGAYGTSPESLLEDLPPFCRPSPRLAQALVEAGAGVIESDMATSVTGLKRAARLLEGDDTRRAYQTALGEVLRPLHRRLGDAVAAAITADQLPARRERLDYDDGQFEGYFKVITLYVDALAQAGEAEVAAEIVAESTVVRRAMTARTGDFAPLIEHVGRHVSLLLQHGAYGDAFRRSAYLVKLGRAADAPHALHEALFGMGFALRGLGFHRDALRQFEQLLADDELDDLAARQVAQQAAAEELIALGRLDEARKLLSDCRVQEGSNRLLEMELEARELAPTHPAESAARFRDIAHSEIATQDDVRIILQAVGELVRLGIAAGDFEPAAHKVNFAFELIGHLSRNDHPARSEFLELAARLELSRNRPHKAFGFMKEAVASDRATAHDLLSLGSAAGRNRRLVEMRRRTEGLVDLARRHYSEDPEAIALAYQAVVRTKALNTAIERINREQVAERTEASEEAAEAIRRLAEIRAALGRLAFSDAADGLDDLAYEKARIETELSATVPSSAIDDLMESCTLRAVEAAVRRDAMFVDFVRHRPLVGGGVRYLAFAIEGGRPTRLIDVGDADEIDAAVTECRTVASTRQPGFLQRLLGTSERILGRRLAKLVLAPLALEDSSARRLVISADGGLLSLPFELLPFGRGFMLDRFVLSYVSSARSLALVDRDEARRPSAPLVLGDPDYSGAPGDGETRSLDFGFSPLPGTKAEVASVADMLAVEPLTGPAASKGAVLAAAGPRIIHLATHGYFIPPHAAPAQLGAHPLLRCGLAFANANSAEGPSEGVLTAEEVLSLDLVSTELAVLSACETALGDLEEGEALAGLARSFEAAGARSAVVSLWKVPDLPTQKLMTAFYTRLAGGASRAHALRAAKIRIRREHPWPRDWAGFVLQGDAGPLQRVV